jgi:WD40 repeat protein
MRQPLLTLGRRSQNDYYQCNRVLFSPDGTRLLSIGENEKVVVWDSLTGKELLTIPVDSEQTGAFALTPDGRRLATAHYGMVRIWDAKSGRAMLQLPMDRKYVAVCLTFSPSGRYLAAPTRDGSVTLWELATGRQTLTFRRRAVEENSRDWICDLAFSPDGRRLAAADTTTGFVTVWDAAGGGIALTLDVKQGRVWDMGFAICKVVFSADGQRIATAGGDREVHLWDARTGKLLHRLEGGLGIAFSPDGRYLATATIPGLEIMDLFGPDGKPNRAERKEKGGEVKVWDVATGREILCWKADADGNVCGLAFSPDGKRLALIMQEYMIKVWDVSDLTRRGLPK